VSDGDGSNSKLKKKAKAGHHKMKRSSNEDPEKKK